MTERLSKRLVLKLTPIEAYIKFGAADLSGPEEEEEGEEEQRRADALHRLVLRVHSDDIEKIKQYAAGLANARKS